MTSISFNLIGGLVFGLEHIGGYDDDEFNWMIVIHVGLFRVIVMNYKSEE